MLVTKGRLDDAAVRVLDARAPVFDGSDLVGPYIRYGSTDAHAAWLEALLADPDIDRVGREHAHDHGDHRAIGSVAVDVPGTLDLEELDDQLAALPASYVRVKGIVRAVDPRDGRARVVRGAPRRPAGVERAGRRPAVAGRQARRARHTPRRRGAGGLRRGERS